MNYSDLKHREKISSNGNKTVPFSSREKYEDLTITPTKPLILLLSPKAAGS